MKSLNDARLLWEEELKTKRKSINEITPAEWDAMVERGAKTQALWETKMNATEEKVMQKIERGALSKQEGGSHYKSMKIQPVEFITANELGFLEGNVVKYICRHHAKNGAEDIKKAMHYCELLLQTKYGETK